MATTDTPPKRSPHNLLFSFLAHYLPPSATFSSTFRRSIVGRPLAGQQLYHIHTPSYVYSSRFVT